MNLAELQTLFLLPLFALVRTITHKSDEIDRNRYVVRSGVVQVWMSCCQGSELTAEFRQDGQSKLSVLSGFPGQKNAEGAWKEIAISLLAIVEIEFPAVVSSEHQLLKETILRLLRQLVDSRM